MHESDAYYEESLYPLQNGVLSTLAACDAPFYLTGGTALHRHYFGFRYSDDLDLFVNQDSGFDGYVDRALAALRERDYRFDGEAFLRTDQYARVLITAEEAALKVDFVNDSAPRFGPVESGGLFPRIDSLRNILSNKVMAVYRLESKDIADLWAICTHRPFHWSDVMAEANQKEAGIDAATVADLSGALGQLHTRSEGHRPVARVGLSRNLRNDPLESGLQATRVLAQRWQEAIVGDLEA